MSRRDFIDNLSSSTNLSRDEAQQFVDRWLPAGGFGDKTNRALSAGTGAIDDYNRALLQSRDSYDQLNSSISAGITSIGSFVGALGSLGSEIPGIGGAFGFLGDAMENVIGTTAVAFDAITGFASDTLGTIDKITLFHRTIDKENFALAKSFGQTFEDAQYYANRFVNNMTEYATVDYGFLSLEELTATRDGFADINVSIEEAMSTVKVGTREMDLYAAATLQAGAMNMSSSQYLRLLEKAMAEQGVTAEEAMKQMATFSDIASETGLNIDTVSSTLNTAADGFTKLGMSADFGRPILEGLARTMSDLGLGIENATGLTTELSRALGSLTTDYATAFVTQQRSGMDFGGGGGLLGASIGLQAQMLEAEQTGDQAGMARMLTEAMSSTISSFTGGDIVTASQAAEDPSLQMAFYSQQQLLGSQYGISDTQSQTRILDYLDQLETARMTGDEDAAALLERQIDEEIQGRDATLGEMEKLNTQINAMLMQSRLQTRSLTVMAAGLGAGARGGISDLYNSAISELTEELNQVDAEADAFIESGRMSQAAEVLNNPSAIMDIIGNMFRGESPLEGVDSFDERGQNINVQINPIEINIRDSVTGEIRGRHIVEDSELIQTPG
tara:strand:- start:8731 stop:10578 length:1848 start_codon:yes stop_codon:yes gene_type:complete